MHSKSNAKSVDCRGDALMRSRQRMAEELSGAIESTLKRLSMPEASLAFEWKPLAEPDEHGIEEVIIAFSANPGHPALPLQKWRLEARKAA